MRQSEQRLQELAVAYAQPAFKNERLKHGGAPITAEAYELFPMFANRPGDKLLPDARVSANQLSPEELATGIAVSYQTSAAEWL